MSYVYIGNQTRSKELFGQCGGRTGRYTKICCKTAVASELCACCWAGTALMMTAIKDRVSTIKP